MQFSSNDVLHALVEAFPQRTVAGVIAPHECEECAALRSGLAGHTWAEVSNSFAQAFSDSLPLLSPDAYNAYLPMWLRAAVENPNGEAASMVAINLDHEPSKSHFTSGQVRALILAVDFVANDNHWGPDDPSNVEHAAAVKATWAAVV